MDNLFDKPATLRLLTHKYSSESVQKFLDQYPDSYMFNRYQVWTDIELFLSPELPLKYTPSFSPSSRLIVEGSTMTTLPHKLRFSIDEFPPRKYK